MASRRYIARRRTRILNSPRLNLITSLCPDCSWSMPVGKSPSYVLPASFRSTSINTLTQARGAVIGALSAANTTFCTPIELRQSLKLGDGTANPYIKRSPVLVSYAEGLTKIPVPEALSEPEAASLFNVWMKDRAISRGTRCLFSIF